MNGGKDFTTVRQVTALTWADIKAKRIRNTLTNRAIVEIMLDLSGPDRLLTISEAEVSLLAGVYLDLRRARMFRSLKELLALDAGFRAFWAGVRSIVATPDGDLRRNGWIKAYGTWELGALENQWWHSPWGNELLAFVRRERLMFYGYSIMANKPHKHEVWEN